jgi:peptidoglycan-N-acetylglucosamine deacetylase
LGARKAVYTRRAVLVIGGLTLVAGIEQEHTKSSASAGEVDAAMTNHPSPSPNRPQPTQTGPAQVKLTGPTQAAPAKTSAPPHASRPSSSAPHPKQTEAKPKKSSRARKDSDDEPIYYIHDGRKRIALTIDDGPSPVYTPQVLALLEKYGISATFSMIGTQVRAYPGIAREVADAGHVIANHTWTHANLPMLSATSISDQISRATGAIHKATGRTPTLFRAPYGAWSPYVLERCAASKLTPVDWSVDPRDWARPGVSAIVNNIMRNTKTGSIILEHDGGGNRSETVAALKIVLPRLINAGYRFVTL